MPDNINASSSVSPEINFHFCASLVTPPITRDDIETRQAEYFHHTIRDDLQRSLDIIANAINFRQKASSNNTPLAQHLRCRAFCNLDTLD